MNTLFLKIVFMIFWVSVSVIRYPHGKRQRKNKIKENRKTPEEKILLFGATLGMGLMPVIYVFTPFLNFADYSLPIWVNILGLLLAGPSLWLFYRSHKDLGLNWSASLEVREEHTLVTDGIYQSIRHPMYTSIWLWVLVQAFLLPNLVAGWAGFVTFGILYVLRVGKEEKMMLQQFGGQYQDYMQKTGRLIPRMGKEKQVH
ncbi:MAG: protein-S-isoprenylcysteine O-methyltransferase [Bacteroidota bacterium]